MIIEMVEIEPFADNISRKCPQCSSKVKLEYYCIQDKWKPKDGVFDDGCILSDGHPHFHMKCVECNHEYAMRSKKKIKKSI